MAATKPCLLLTGTGASQLVHLVNLLDDGTIVVPLHWVFTRKSVKGCLCMPEMTCGDVERQEFKGIAGPRAAGLPWYSSVYLLMMVVGLLMLSIPVRVKPVLLNVRPIKPEDLVRQLTEAVRRNPNHYTRASATDIERLLQRTKTFAQMRRAFE